MADTPSPDDPIFGDKPDEPIGGSPAGGAPVPPPPPPPPAGPPVAPPPAPGAGPAPSSSVISDAFSWAVETFRANAAVFIGLAAIVFALRAAQTFTSNAIVSTDVSSTNLSGAFAAVLGVTAILSIVFAILTALASIGVYRAALRRTQGVQPSFDQLTTGENLGKFIVVAIVLGLTVAVGILLCILPGLLAIFFFMFAPYLALDKGMGVGDAFRTSARMVLDNLGTVVVAALINIVANLLSGLIFGVLVLIMLPFSALFTAYVYRRIQGEPVAP